MIPPKHPDDRVALGGPVAGDVHVDGQYVARTESWRPRRASGDDAGGLSRRKSDGQAGNIPRVCYPESNRTIFPSPFAPGRRLSLRRTVAFVENGRTSKTGPAES